MLLLLYRKTLYVRVFLFLCLPSGKTMIICDTWAVLCIYTIGIRNNKENMKLLLLGTAKPLMYWRGGRVTPSHPQCTAWLSRTKANTEHGIVWKNSETVAGTVFPWIWKQTSSWEANYLCSRVHWLLWSVSHWIISKPEVLGRHQVTFWCKSPRWNNNSCCRATASRWGQGLCVFGVHCVTCTVWTS